MIEIDKIESSPGCPNPFQVNVEVRGHGQISGLLTREILNGLTTRSVLLLPEESVVGFLPRAEAEALNELREIATGLDIKRLGRVAVLKEIVVGLFRRQRHYPMECVLVHRYGPVPGILIETNAKSPLEPDAPLYLGIHLNFRDQEQPTKKLGFSSINLLHSLEYYPQILFQRYFEDVGAIFDSIGGRADLSRTLWWAKWIETIIAESVNSKLVTIFPKSKRDGLQEQLARRRREEHPYQFLRAAYARYVCLHLVNILYECLGFWSSNKYRNHLLNFRAEYEAFFQYETISGAFSNDPALSDLERIFDALEDGLKGEPTDKFQVDLSSRQTWVTQVCEFARFVWFLRTHGTPRKLDPSRTYDPTIANVFISSHHAVPVAKAVRKELWSKTSDGRDAQPEIQLMYVREAAGTPFLGAIKGRIWLSDGLIAVIPASTQKFDATSADYKWIGEEALAALSLNKELLFVVQRHPQGTPHISRLMEEVKSLEGVIFGATNLEDLKRDLLDHVRNITNKTFLVSDEGSIDEPLVDAFKIFSRQAYSNRTNQLVRGFLRQLSNSVFYRLRGLRQAVGTPEEIMTLLMKSSKHSRLPRITFKTLYDKARERRLIINGLPHYLMVAVKQNKQNSTQGTARYAWNLTEILRKLRPFATEEEIQVWEDSLMEWADREAARGDSSIRV